MAFRELRTEWRKMPVLQLFLRIIFIDPFHLKHSKKIICLNLFNLKKGYLSDFVDQFWHYRQKIYIHVKRFSRRTVQLSKELDFNV